MSIEWITILMFGSLFLILALKSELEADRIGLSSPHPRVEIGSPPRPKKVADDMAT
jgi:hypothetical protein